MYRKTFEDMNCSIARALDQIGEWWSLLIVRECTLGTARFDDFQRRLGIARNVLTSRLNHLVERGILEKKPLAESARFFQYQLTPKGEALYPVLIALLQWGDRWAETGRGPPLRLVEKKTGKLVDPVCVRAKGGRALSMREVRLEAGPGASDGTRATIARRNSAILGGEAASRKKKSSRRARAH